jgi:hypothetical protein
MVRGIGSIGSLGRDAACEELNRRKRANVLGLVHIAPLYATRAADKNAPSLDFLWLAYRRPTGNWQIAVAVQFFSFCGISRASVTD